MKRAKLYIILIIIAVIIGLFLPFLLVGLYNLTRNWSLLPNQFIHWDVTTNLNNQIELDYVQCTFPDLEQSQTVRWSVNLFNPYSSIRTDWVKVYGPNAWIDRADTWQLTGTFNYNLTGNLDENIPVDLNINGLLAIPVRGSAGITIEKLAANAGGTITINYISYSVVDEIYTYKLTTILISPSPNIDSINEVLYFNKLDGTLMQSVTSIQGTDYYGWNYTKTITVGQSILFWIILIIILASSGGITLAIYVKKHRPYQVVDEEL